MKASIKLENKEYRLIHLNFKNLIYKLVLSLNPFLQIICIKSV